MPTATSSRRHRKLRSWQPLRISRTTNLRKGTRKDPCISPHSPDSDSSDLRSTKTLLRSRRRKLRSGATGAPPLHPKRRRSMTFLEGRRARIAINATTTPETRLHSANLTKARAKRACSSESEMDEDEGELCGARCFSRSVRRTQMPRNFKLPSDTPKFNGMQDPKPWLSDHLSSVKLHRGNKDTAMQCLQLQLTGAARVWLSSLSSGSIRSWEELSYSFIRNFKGTIKRPASIEELRACTQRTRESIRSYILRWSTTKNCAAHISEERAIDAFRDGVKRQDFKEELGRVKPKTLDHLMEIANSWADGEDCIQRAQSDEEDDYGRRRERRSKRKSRVYEDRDGPGMVAAGYADRRNDTSRNDTSRN